MTTAPFLLANLLLILPDDVERRQVAAHLTRAFYQVTSSSSGIQGLELAALDLTMLIVADVDLPDMDGYACCRLLKANAATNGIPLILVGAACTARERIAGLTLGAVDFLSKPYDLDELTARIRVHLRLGSRMTGTSEDDITGTPARTSLDDIAIAAAQRLIDGQLSSLPGLDEIARAAGTYRERLNGLFRERFGCSVFDYARTRRFERATRLLEETELSIVDIAQVIGYPTARNFSTAFRARTGITPGEWRRRTGAGQDS